MPERIEFFDLIYSRTKIAKAQAPITLTNAPGTIRRLGAPAIHKIFEILCQEFQIEEKIFRVDDNLAGLYQALKLGYKHILYTGNSQSAKKLLQNYSQSC
jgi:hypothetical protein